jgi:hypothetical protein
MPADTTTSTEPIRQPTLPPAQASIRASIQGPTNDRCVRFGVFPECPLCGGGLHPEHAHFKCGSCGWRDSCCD